MSKRSLQISQRKAVCIILLILIIGGACLYSANKVGLISFFGDSNGEQLITDKSGINFSPPTEEEKQAGDKQKEIIDNEPQEQTSQDLSDNRSTVNVVITDAGQYGDTIEIRSFIPNHMQDGTCTIVLSMGIQKIVKEVPAKRDVSSTVCLNPNLERNQFPSKGIWQLTVSYSSKDAQGMSEAQQLRID